MNNGPGYIIHNHLIKYAFGQYTVYNAKRLLARSISRKLKGIAIRIAMQMSTLEINRRVLQAIRVTSTFHVSVKSKRLRDTTALS
jgi:hypothetical protein